MTVFLWQYWKKCGKMAKTDIKSMQLDRLKEYVVSLGAKPFAAKQIYGWLHEKNVNSFDEMTNISKDLREKLKENFHALMEALIKAKPAAAKGQYVKSVTVSSTMGPGAKVNPTKVLD